MSGRAVWRLQKMLTTSAPASSQYKRNQQSCRTSVTLNVVQPRKRRARRGPWERVPSFGIRNWRRNSAGWPNRNKPVARGPAWSAGTGPRVMGAGVATNPHFPRVQTAVPVKACTSSLGGSGPDTSLAALAGSFSGPDQPLLPGGPLPSRWPILLSRQPLVCGSAALKLRFHRTVSESGSGTGFRRASRFFLVALPTLSTAAILADDAPCSASAAALELSTAAGRPLLATRRNCHHRPSRAKQIRLWIRCITGIRRPP